MSMSVSGDVSNSMKYLSKRLEQLLSEDLRSVMLRESSVLEEKMGGLDHPFVLFGAGQLGRKVLRKLEGLGKWPLAFIDNNSALWGTQVDGLTVMSPAQVALQHDASKIGVITTIWCGEAADRMSDRINPLFDLGYTKIALFAHLAWKFPEEFLPNFCIDRPSNLLKARDQIFEAFKLLSDYESRELFVNHIEWRLHMEYEVLPPASELTIYFNEKYTNILSSEVLYDIGAYNGDSVVSVIDSARGKIYREVHCFEPSPQNFRELSATVSRLNAIGRNVFAHQLALGNNEGNILIEADNGPSSRVGVGGEVVRLTSIDQFSSEHTPPTFIKIDIEGFEPQCLDGAKSTIRTAAPVVAVSVYHIQGHLWEIILQLYSYNSDYIFSLCPHVSDGWDLVLYAVPPYRSPLSTLA